MIENSYYSQEVHGPYELHDIGNLELEEGGMIRRCTLAVATFGALNVARDNPILIPTWYSGTSKIMDQIYIGKGPRPGSRQILHHHHQSDRQWPIHFAAQHAGARGDGKFPACPHRRRCAGTAQAGD